MLYPFTGQLFIKNPIFATMITRTRNFCIIAHIDHGKSTLADRLLEVTQTVAKKNMRAQLLDDMDLERERGITIKSHAIQMRYHHQGEPYILNLIDTPGHVDFSYEVSRAVAACEGALMVIDAAQGIEAQTLANLDLALSQNLAIIPVLNKVDLPNARSDEVSEEIIQLLDCKKEDIIHASAKEGIGIHEILQAIITNIPPPKGDATAPLQAMVFDALYDPFRGVKVYFRIFNGTLRQKDPIQFFQTKKKYQTEEIGILTQTLTPKSTLRAGDVGYLTANIKQAKEVKIGDTLTHAHTPCEKPIEGFAEVKPMVFAGIYPVANNEYENLRKAIEKLQLNDAALVWQPETSQALGFGFRCGFLGMLHMEIVKERLARESNIDIIMTSPSVSLRIMDKHGKLHIVHTPAEMPDPGQIQSIEEPIVEVNIITQSHFIGRIMELCIQKRGIFKNQIHLSANRVELIYKIPLGEIVFDFFDRLKSISQGYASLEYQAAGFSPSNLVKLDILIHGEKVDALATIVHRDSAYYIGKRMCEKAQELIPKHLFEIPIQAAINQKIIARTTLKALRKNVTEGLYGGDISRKKKQLAAQKKGKKRMKLIGKVRDGRRLHR